jgi:hypothetical protein
VRIHTLKEVVALVAAKALLETVAPALLPTERRDAFEEFYRIATMALDAWEIQSRRELIGLTPSCN